MNTNQELPFKAPNQTLRKYKTAIQGRVCVLEGLISAGKSTAGEELTRYVTNLGIPCRFFPEPLIPDLLQLFLSNQKKYALAFQIAMLVKRQAIYREAWEWAKKGFFCIIDRSLYGDYCFALMHKKRGNISEDAAYLDQTSLSEWKTYLSVMHAEEFEHPDYVLYLEVTPDTAIERCKRRDREGEKQYDRDYFQELCDVYGSVIPSSPSKCIDVIDWNKDREIKDIAPFLLERIRKLYDGSLQF